MIFMAISANIPELNIDINHNLNHHLDEGHSDMYSMGLKVTILACAGYIIPFFLTFPLYRT